MGLNAKTVKSNAGTRVEQPVLEPAGYPGRLVQVIDYGLQNQRPFKGEEKPPAPEIGLTYELSDEFMIDKEGKVLEDKPRWQSEIIPLHNLVAEKAKSTQRYYALDPEEKQGGDFVKLLGTPCIINIVNNPRDGKVYNNVGSLSTIRAKDAEKLPPLVNKPSAFLLDEPDLELFNSFPEFIKTKIKANLNYNGSPLQKLLGEKSTAKPPVDVEAEVSAVEAGVDGSDNSSDDVPW